MFRGSGITGDMSTVDLAINGGLVFDGSGGPGQPAAAPGSRSTSAMKSSCARRLTDSASAIQAG